MFNLNDYETVEERLEKFWKQYPDGRIETELIEATGTRFIVLARIFRTEADARYWTSGLAYENISERGVNSTSALENCETSAIGRALANAGFATKGKRPSREEMSKASRGSFERVSARGGIEPKADAWTIKTENPADPLEVVETKMPEPLDLAEALGSTETVPHCKHGEMTRKEGTTKAGKAYMGYVCTGYVQSGSDAKCDPIWYELTSSGKWKPQEKR